MKSRLTNLLPATMSLVLLFAPGICLAEETKPAEVPAADAPKAEAEPAKPAATQPAEPPATEPAEPAPLPPPKPYKAPEGAVVISTADGKGADTAASYNKKEATAGDQDRMIVMNQGRGGFQAYIRFDLAKAPKELKGAYLVLHVVPNTGKQGVDKHVFNLFALNDGEREDWSEAEITASEALAAPAKGIGGKYDPEEKTGGGVDNEKATFVTEFSFDNTDFRMSKPKAPVYISGEKLLEAIKADTNGTITFIITKIEVSRGRIASFGTKEGKDVAPKLVLSEKELAPPAE